MIRKLIVILLSGVIYLIGVTSALAYNQAPMLKAMVDAGELEPLEERLPENPCVIEPIEKIGNYGGTIHYVSPDQMWNGMVSSRMVSMLSHPSQTALDVTIPHVAEGWQWNEDKTCLTLYLREGLKWSDGYPFTADDILFGWEDTILDERLCPFILNQYKPGDELMQVEKVDDYTVRLRFAVPYSQELNLLAAEPFGGDTVWTVTGFYAPKHYLKKFHIKYNPKADELAREAGYENWWELFGDKHNPYREVDYPTLSPWICKEATETIRIYERNPYYWAVDPAGNQLPYIDRGVVNIVGTLDVYNMKIIAGQADFAALSTAIQNYSLYKENEEKGGYQVFAWSEMEGRQTLKFNQNHSDPIKRKIFQDVRFRQAMSLALDREEINKIFYFGLGKPTQFRFTGRTAAFWEDWWEDYYAGYYPERAKELLDEMGLDNKDSEGYRLRPDGKRLVVTVEFVANQPWAPETTGLCELIKEWWGEVGIDAKIKPETVELWRARIEGPALHDVAMWTAGANGDARGLHEMPKTSFLPASNNPCYPKWGVWLETDGERGEKPPEIVFEIKELCEKWARTSVGTEEYKRLGKKLSSLYYEQLWLIGLVTSVPHPVLIKKNLRNIPEEIPYVANDFSYIYPQTWFLE